MQQMGKIDTLLISKSAVVTLASGSVLWETNRVLAMVLAWRGKEQFVPT